MEVLLLQLLYGRRIVYLSFGHRAVSRNKVPQSRKVYPLGFRKRIAGPSSLASQERNGYRVVESFVVIPIKSLEFGGQLKPSAAVLLFSWGNKSQNVLLLCPFHQPLVGRVFLILVTLWLCFSWVLLLLLVIQDGIDVDRTQLVQTYPEGN